MPKLKPCPFCGCPPHMDKHEIFCDCGVKFEFPINEWGCSDENPEGFPTYEQAKNVAVERWNERVSEPVRHGYWSFFRSIAGDEYTFECSECNEWADRRHNYCPDCGAKMDRGGKHGAY